MSDREALIAGLRELIRRLLNGEADADDYMLAGELWMWWQMRLFTGDNGEE